MEVKPPGVEIDPKLASCFPDVEKTTNPLTVYSKAGVAVEKRVKKLGDYKTEMGTRNGSENLDKKLVSK